VILVDGAAVETTDQLFDALVTGFSQAGAVVNEGGAKRGTRRGSDYRCVGAAAGAETAVACMWRDEDNVGIVLAPSTDVRGTRQLLWTIHDTIVS
jgi:RES domain-containing protein